jgi:methanogenic corrinoid protein MtbC1
MNPRAGHSIAIASRLSGVPIETLRAWERRYGFPQPARIEGSNRRLYTEPDIARLRWVARAIANGFRVGDVVHRTPGEIEALLGETAAPAEETPPARTALPSVTHLVERLAADDVATFDLELRRLAGALGPKAFVTDVAHPLAVEVGRAWEKGLLAVRQEHYASEALLTQLRIALGPLQDVPGTPTVLLATLPGEQHGLGLAMIALYLSLSGAKPRIVGTNTPVEEIAAAAGAFGAHVVGLTITPASIGTGLEGALRSLERAMPRGTRLWLGGSAAGRVRTARGREVIGDWATLDRAIERARVATEGFGGQLGGKR